MILELFGNIALAVSASAARSREGAGAIDPLDAQSEVVRERASRLRRVAIEYFNIMRGSKNFVRSHRARLRKVKQQFDADIEYAAAIEGKRFLALLAAALNGDLRIYAPLRDSDGLGISIIADSNLIMRFDELTQRRSQILRDLCSVASVTCDVSTYTLDHAATYESIFGLLPLNALRQVAEDMQIVPYDDSQLDTAADEDVLTLSVMNINMHLSSFVCLIISIVMERGVSGCMIMICLSHPGTELHIMVVWATSKLTIATVYHVVLMSDRVSLLRHQAVSA